MLLALFFQASVLAQNNAVVDQTYFSAPPTNFWNALLQTNRPLRVMWLGDSVGADTFTSMEANIAALRPVAGGSFFRGFPLYLVQFTGPWSQPDSGLWYQAPFRMFAGATSVWASNAPGGLVFADTLSVSYLGQAGDGSFRVEYSTNGSQWTVLEVVDASVGSGFTNRSYPLPRGSYQARLVSLGGGISNKVDILWVALTPNFMNAPQLMGMTRGGISFDNIVGVGSNSFCSMLRFAQPDLVVIEEKHDPFTYTNGQAEMLAVWLKATAPAADVVYVGSHVTAESSEPALTQGQNLWFRSFAMSHGWSYVDGFSQMSTWAEIMEHGWNADTVHLSAAGRKVMGDFLVAKLGLRPAVTRAERGELGALTLFGTAVPGLEVTLQMKSGLTAGVWQNVATNRATNGTFTFTRGASSSNQFYRVGAAVP